MAIDDNQWQSIMTKFLLIDWSLISDLINRLLSIAIDCYRLSVSSIGQAGPTFKSKVKDLYVTYVQPENFSYVLSTHGL